jgi:DNA-binding SARP family transcriptional activator/tetratricopeptide (TPR) repeat protein
MNTPHSPVSLSLAKEARICAADGHEIVLTDRYAALLALLAVEGPHSRARILELLWPSERAEVSGNRLRQRLFNLRRACGHPVVVGQATLSLSPDLVHDLADADTLLGTLHLNELPVLDEWLQAERQRRVARHRERLCRHLQDSESRQEWDAALSLAHSLLLLDPLSEDAHRRLIRMQYLRGDHAAARLAFDHCAQLLKEELGASPSAETLQLLASLQRAVVPAAGTAVAAVRRQVPVSVLRPPRLVGRVAEWSWLALCWDTPCIALVLADGGMGKSRLLADFAAARRQPDQKILLVGARPGDARLPCATISRVLRELLRDRPMTLPEGVRGELARLLPEFGIPGPATAADRSRFVNALLSTLSLAHQQGLTAVMVDDLQWADDGSIELLEQLCADVPLRWIFAMRPAELSASAGKWIESLQTDRLAQAQRLEPLTLPQVAELLASLDLAEVGAPTWAEALHRRTGGNPQYLLECVKALLSQAGAVDLPGLATLPASSQLIQLRLSRLSPPSVKLARCAAVAGPDFSAALASGVLHVDALDLTDAWNELEAAQVLRDGAFAHDLIYEAVLASVPAPIARELHLAMAACLEAAREEPARIAAHWLEGGHALNAAPHLVMAAEAAKARLRFTESADAYERAAEIYEAAGHPAAFDTYYSAADALTRVYGGERFARQAAALERLARTDSQRARAGVARSAVEGEAGRFDEAERIAEQSLEPAQRSGEREAESELEWTLGAMCWEDRRIAGAVRHIERSLALHQALEPQWRQFDHVDGLMKRMQGLGTMLRATGRFSESLHHLQEAWHTGIRLGQAPIMLTTSAELAITQVQIGNLPAAQLWIETAGRLLSDGEPSETDRVRAVDVQAHVLALSGRWGEALEKLGFVAEWLETRTWRSQAQLQVHQAQFFAVLGRRDLALKAAQKGLASAAAADTQRLVAEVALATIEQRADVSRLLERISALDDVGLRARLLIKLAPHCEPTPVLPLLAMLSTTLRQGGGLGLSLSLESRACAQLTRAGRQEEAAAKALAAWRQFEQGTFPFHWVPEFAADLRLALLAVQPELAQEVTRRGAQWLQDAASTLPPMWRDNCLQRSPLRLGLTQVVALQAAR